MEKWRFIIQSFTTDEKKNPDIINEARRKRIARGSGVMEHDVKDLIKQYNNSKTMMKQAKGRQMQGLIKEIWSWLKPKENLKTLKLKNSNQLQIHLCRFCYDRNFSKKKISLVKHSVSVTIIKTGMKVCYICRNFFLRTLPSIVNKISNSEMFDQPRVFLLLI